MIIYRDPKHNDLLMHLKVAAIEAAEFEPTRKTLADTLALPNTYGDIPE